MFDLSSILLSSFKLSLILIHFLFSLEKTTLTKHTSKSSLINRLNFGFHREDQRCLNFLILLMNNYHNNALRIIKPMKLIYHIFCILKHFWDIYYIYIYTISHNKVREIFTFYDRKPAPSSMNFWLC